MNHFVAVDALVGRLEGIERELSRLIAERATVLVELAVEARVGVTSLVTASDLSRRDREAVSRRAVISDVAAATHTTENVVTSLMAEAEILVRSFPSTLSALCAGELTHRQAQVIVGEACDLEVEASGDLEARLLLLARSGNHVTLRRQARRERERVVPESFEVRHARANTHRNVRIEHVRDGMSWINAYVPTTFASAFDDRSQALALAHQQAGDTRSRDQLITDALVAALMAGDDGGSGAGAGAGAGSGSGAPATTSDQPAISSLLESFRRIQPKITMTVPALALLGHRTGPDGMPLDPAEIDGVGPIDPETARQLCGQATSFVRILTDPVTGGPIGIDERARIPSKRLKAWLRYRDGVCRHPGCSRPAIRCDLDHTCEYAHGGATCENNLAHLCRRHHRLKHLTNWRYTHGPAGSMQFTSPTGRRYDSPPERRVLKT